MENEYLILKKFISLIPILQPEYGNDLGVVRNLEDAILKLVNLFDYSDPVEAAKGMVLRMEMLYRYTENPFETLNIEDDNDDNDDEGEYLIFNQQQQDMDRYDKHHLTCPMDFYKRLKQFIMLHNNNNDDETARIQK